MRSVIHHRPELRTSANFAYPLVPRLVPPRAHPALVPPPQTIGLPGAITFYAEAMRWIPCGRCPSDNRPYHFLRENYMSVSDPRVHPSVELAHLSDGPTAARLRIPTRIALRIAGRHGIRLHNLSGQSGQIMDTVDAARFFAAVQEAARYAVHEWRCGRGAPSGVSGAPSADIDGEHF